MNSTEIEVGAYKLIKGEILGEIGYAIIRVGIFRSKMIASTKTIPSQLNIAIMNNLLNTGRLCDSYLSKKDALHDLDKLR